MTDTTQSRPPINPDDAQLLQSVREALGLSVAQMAQALGMLGDTGSDNIRQMERGKRAVTGPVSVLLRYMATGARVALPVPSEALRLAEQTRQRLQVAPRW